MIDYENKWMEEIGRRDPNAIAIVEAALILESGAADRFDHLIVVTCRPDQRVRVSPAAWQFQKKLPVSK